MRFNIDEILDNPKNYIMVFGVKYVSIRNVSKFKLYRHERKDVVDLWLISKSHLKFAHNAAIAFFHFYKGYLREIRNLLRRFAK